MNKKSFKSLLKAIGYTQKEIDDMMRDSETHHKDSSLPVTVYKYPKAKPSLKPSRDTIISKDEILNLKIDLNNCKSVEKFLEVV